MINCLVSYARPRENKKRTTLEQIRIAVVNHLVVYSQ